MNKTYIVFGFAFWLLIQTCTDVPPPKPAGTENATITTGPQ
jgi:hypothetical protein